MNSSRSALSSASVFFERTPSVLMLVKICGAFDLIKARYNSSKREISEVWSLSRKPLTPAYKMQTCSSAGIGTYCFCLSNSVSFSPLLRSYWVAASKSEPNWAKAATSRYWASSSLSEPATCFMALIWAAEPTRETERPTLMAGLTPL